MSIKPETRLTTYLRSKLDPSIFVMKTNNAYISGPADLYLEGSQGICWVEVKFIAKPWTKDRSSEKICPTTGWIHQRQWLERAHSNNVNTAVLVGTGLGKQTRAYLLSHPYSFSFLNDPLQDIPTIAARLKELCLVLRTNK